jgi:hypothetical protein
VSDETFEGFVRPEKNYFPMPNEWIDICARIDNLAELKVIQYVLRHTWGYREYGITKTISVDEFMHGRKRNDGTRMDEGTGLKSDRSVKDGIRAAIKHGYLVFEVDTSDPARTRKSYALKMIGTGVDTTRGVDTTPVNSENTGVVSTPLTGSIYPPQGYNLPPKQVDTTPRTEKDTRETHLEKDTRERQESVAPASLTEYKQRKETDPQMPVVKPSKQTQARPPAPEIPPEAVRIMDEWDSLFKRPSPRTENHIKAAISLLASIPTKDDLNNVRKFCFSSNPDWYRNKGVTLQDVAKNFEKWQSLQEMPSEQTTSPPTTSRKPAVTGKDLREAREQRARASGQ